MDSPLAPRSTPPSGAFPQRPSPSPRPRPPASPAENIECGRLAEALAAVAFDFGRHMTQIYASIDTAYESYAGSTHQVVAYFRDNPDILTILVRAAAGRSETCHCFCQWAHVGECVGVSQTSRLSGGEMLPFCLPCARALDTRRDEVLGREHLPPTDLIGP